MRRLLWVIVSLALGACGGGGETELLDPDTPTAGRLLLTPSHGDAGAAWGLGECDSCHALAVIHRSAPAKTREIVRDKGYDTCTACHGSNGTQRPRQCLICHNRQDLPDTPPLHGDQAHHFDPAASGALNDSECLVCHAASDMDGQFSLIADLTTFPDLSGQMTTYDSEVEFCLRCHNRDHQQPGYEITGSGYDDPLVALEDDYRHLDFHGWRDGSNQGTYSGLRTGYHYPDFVACSDCHAMHATRNQKLIIDTSAKGARQLDPAFRLADLPVTIGDAGDYSQLCVLCHQMDTVIDAGDVDTGNGLSGVHEVGSDCRPCHTHGEATQVGL